MKKDTVRRHKKIANDIMHYIYKHIDTDINLDELSINMDISKFHMHRIFKEEFEQNIYEAIKSIRLTKASTLLLTNKNSTITSVAKMCGYTSHGAFIRVFKNRFNMTPKEWKKGGYKTLVKFEKSFEYESVNPEIIKNSSKEVLYIRHKGYDKSIKNIWEKLIIWLYQNDIQDYTFIGYYHDIPAITSLKECKYTAGVIVNEKVKNTTFPTLIMPKIVYAKFKFKGFHKEFLDFINWIHFYWLVKSGYETTPEPSFCIYKNNSFLKNDIFEADYYVSVYV